ncbi:hypothetical protein D3C81_2258160 [compost metagenome]
MGGKELLALHGQLLIDLRSIFEQDLGTFFRMLNRVLVAFFRCLEELGDFVWVLANCFGA